MFELDEIGNTIILRHKPTSENHFGEIIDVNVDGFVVKMEPSASIYLDDHSYLIDTRYNQNWEFVRKVKRYGTEKT